jgi:hypothetical protein
MQKDDKAQAQMDRQERLANWGCRDLPWIRRSKSLNISKNRFKTARRHEITSFRNLTNPS